jgi:hypothetical protein
MTEHPDLWDDDELLARLGRALDATDPVPDDAVAVARSAYELRGADDELATLVADSLHDEPVLVRHDDAGARQLSYTTSRLSVDLEIASDGRTLFGVVSPAGEVAVEIETPGPTIEATTDQLGRFRVELARGWCRVRVRGSGATLVTPVIVR